MLLLGCASQASRQEVCAWESCPCSPTSPRLRRVSSAARLPQRSAAHRILAGTPLYGSSCHSRCRSVFSWNTYSTQLRQGWGGGGGGGGEQQQGQGEVGMGGGRLLWAAPARRAGCCCCCCCMPAAAAAALPANLAPPPSSPMRVLLQAFQERRRQLGPQREARPRRRHQQRLPRRAVAAGEAGTQDADGPQREGQLLQVQRRLRCCCCPSRRRRRCPLGCVGTAATRRGVPTAAAAALLRVLPCGIVPLGWQGRRRAALQLAQPQLQLPHLPLQQSANWRGSEVPMASGSRIEHSGLCQGPTHSTKSGPAPAGQAGGCCCCPARAASLNYNTTGVGPTSALTRPARSARRSSVANRASSCSQRASHHAGVAGCVLPLAPV